jgi:hypothetical protein
LVTLDGGKIQIAGDSSVGLFGDNGAVNANGTLTISMTGTDSYGVEARGTALVQINPNTIITTAGRGGFGIFALAGGTVTANGIAITTSGILSLSGFNADGAAALGGQSAWRIPALQPAATTRTVCTCWVPTAGYPERT